MLNLFEGSLEKRESERDSFIRNGILSYLESHFKKEIENIINASSDNIFNFIRQLLEGYEDETGKVKGGLRSQKDAMHIRGETQRLLEAYPDHPGLLILRAVTELYSAEPDWSIIFDNLNAGIEFSLTRYSFKEKDAYQILTWVLIKIFEYNPKKYEEFVAHNFKTTKKIEILKAIIFNTETNEEMLVLPSELINNHFAQKAINLIQGA